MIRICGLEIAAIAALVAWWRKLRKKREAV